MPLKPQQKVENSNFDFEKVYEFEIYHFPTFSRVDHFWKDEYIFVERQRKESQSERFG